MGKDQINLHSRNYYLIKTIQTRRGGLIQKQKSRIRKKRRSREAARGDRGKKRRKGKKREREEGRGKREKKTEGDDKENTWAATRAMSSPRAGNRLCLSRAFFMFSLSSSDSVHMAWIVREWEKINLVDWGIHSSDIHTVWYRELSKVSSLTDFTIYIYSNGTPSHQSPWTLINHLDKNVSEELSILV